MKKMFSVLMIVAMLCAALSVSAADFPLRAKYPDVKPITTDELAGQYNQAVIVDVRWPWSTT